jgi:transposase
VESSGLRFSQEKEQKMTRRKRRNHSSAFKAKVALAAVKGDRTLAELAEQFDIPPKQIQDWKKRLVEGAEELFGGAAAKAHDNEQAVEKLHAKIGQLARQRTIFYPKCSEPTHERAPSTDSDQPSTAQDPAL